MKSQLLLLLLFFFSCSKASQLASEEKVALAMLSEEWADPQPPSLCEAMTRHGPDPQGTLLTTGVLSTVSKV